MKWFLILWTLLGSGGSKSSVLVWSSPWVSGPLVLSLDLRGALSMSN